MANKVARRLFCVVCGNMINMSKPGPDGSYACSIRTYYGEDGKKVLNPNPPCGTRFAVSVSPATGGVLVAFSSENAKQIAASQQAVLN
ncbi:MAG: hypothetical protein HYS43_00015 [Candidatus Liptonbacteria bacterium]|nr:hypothetical protein [Candidatus Liptonbacteria bacterium]